LKLIRRGIVSAEIEPCEDEAGFSEKKKTASLSQSNTLLPVERFEIFPRKLGEIR
jgi:hypothetical protein